MLLKLKTNRGQNFLDYTMMVTLVVAGIIIMGPYIMRSWNAQVKGWEDSIEDSTRDPLVDRAGDLRFEGCQCSNPIAEACGGGIDGAIQCDSRRRLYRQNCSGLCPPVQGTCAYDDECCSTPQPTGSCGTDAVNVPGGCPDGAMEIQKFCGEPSFPDEPIYECHCADDLVASGPCADPYPDCATDSCSGDPRPAPNEHKYGNICPGDDQDIEGVVSYKFVTEGECSQPAEAVKCEVECAPTYTASTDQGLCICEPPREDDGFTCACLPPWDENNEGDCFCPDENVSIQESCSKNPETDCANLSFEQCLQSPWCSHFNNVCFGLYSCAYTVESFCLAANNNQHGADLCVWNDAECFPPAQLDCRALPREDGQDYLDCADGEWELFRYCEENCDGDDARVTYCCNDEFRPPLRCTALTTFDDRPFPSCPSGYTKWFEYASGNGDGDDNKVTYCCENDNEAPVPNCRALPTEDGNDYRTCGAGEYELLRYCSGNCSGDDAKVTYCCQL